MSSITPLIAKHASNGSLAFITGSAGGSRIITASIQNLIHALDGKLSAFDSLAKPRLHDQLIPNVVGFEHGYDESTVAYMKSLGHNAIWMEPSSSSQAIRVLPNGTFDAAGEPRQVASGGVAV